MPDFFVVGHAKSGTTALYAMLSQHPQLFLGIKEPRYFATELHFRDRPGGTPKTLADYKAWFRPRDARPADRRRLARLPVVRARRRG